MSNPSWFSHCPFYPSHPCCVRLFSVHKTIMSPWTPAGSSAHCIVSHQWADVSPTYKTPGGCIVYCPGPSQVQVLILPFTKLWVGLVQFLRTLELWEGRAPVQRRGFPERVTGEKCPPKDWTSLHRIACSIRNPHGVSHSLSAGRFEVIQCNSRSGRNLNVPVLLLLIYLSRIFFSHWLYFGIQF